MSEALGPCPTCSGYGIVEHDTRGRETWIECQLCGRQKWRARRQSTPKLVINVSASARRSRRRALARWFDLPYRIVPSGSE